MAVGTQRGQVHGQEERHGDGDHRARARQDRQGAARHPRIGRVIIERLNIVKRHSKPRGAASPGGIVEKEAPMQISNVMVFCDRCNAPVRVGIKKAAADGASSRVCRRCGEALGNE